MRRKCTLLFFVSAKQSNKRKPTGANCSAWHRRLCAKDVGFSSAGWRWFFCLGLRRLGFLFVLGICFLVGFCEIFYGEKMRLYGLGCGVVTQFGFWDGWVATSPTQAGRCIGMGRSETLRPVGCESICRCLEVITIVANVVRHLNAPFFLCLAKERNKERRPAPTAPHGAGGSARRTQGSLQPGGAGFSA